MKRLVLKIDGAEVDTPVDFTIPISYSVNSVADVASRNADFSVELSLPQTAKNRGIFLGNQYSILPAQIIELGCLVSIATCEVVSLTDTINIRLESGNATFFQMLDGRNLSDMRYYKLYDHDWTLTNIQLSQYHTWQNTYLYVIANPGTIRERPFEAGVSQVEVYPALFVKKIFLDLIGSMGYTAVGDFLDTPTFSTLLLDSGDVMKYTDEQLKNWGVIAGVSPSQYVDSNAGAFGGDAVRSGRFPFNLTQNAFGSIYEDLGNNFDEVNHEYTAPQDLVIEPTITLPFDLVMNLVGKIYVTAKMLVDGQVVYELRETYSGKLSSVISKKERVYQRTFPQTLVKKGQVVHFDYETGRGNDVAAFKNTLKFNEGCRLELKVYPFVVPGARIEINSLLPDMDAKDFLISLAVPFCLLFIVDEKRKEVRVEKFQKVVDNIPRSIDWTTKIDLSESPEETFDSENYGQTSILQWGETDGYTGAGSITLLNKKLELEKIVFDSKMDATPTVESFEDGGTLASVQRYSVGEDKRFSPWVEDSTYFNSPDQDYVEYRGRFFRCKENNVSGDPPLFQSPFFGNIFLPNFNWEEISLIDFLSFLGSNNAGIRMYYVKRKPQIMVRWELSAVSLWNFADFEELDFSRLVNTYYAGLSTALYAAKYLRVLVRLKPADIQHLDYTRPILIHTKNAKYGQRIDGHWYISEIEQYKHGSSESCWVALVRVVPTVQNEIRRAVIANSVTVLGTELDEAIYTDKDEAFFISR